MLRVSGVSLAVSGPSPTSLADLTVQKKIGDRSLFSSVHSLNAYAYSHIPCKSRQSSLLNLSLHGSQVPLTCREHVEIWQRGAVCSPQKSREFAVIWHLSQRRVRARLAA